MKIISLVSLLAGATTAVFAQDSTSQLVNLSSRGLVGSGAGSLKAGFVVAGTTAKDVLIRGTGPGLGAFGDLNPAAAVNINVFDSSGNLVASNAGVLTPDPQAAQMAAAVGAFPQTAPGDSALIATLAPGPYTIQIAPNSADSPDGDALLEVYDADPLGSGSAAVNASTFGQIGANAGTMITGFVIGGSANKNVLLRGVGPDLAAFGATNSAAGVGINVYDSNGNLVASNYGYLNDPNSAATAQIASAAGAFALGNPGDSELVVSLPPGAYSVEAVPTSADAIDGVALLEVYDADSAVSAMSQTSGN